MNNVTYQPKKKKMKRPSVPFMPSYMQFYKWDRDSKKHKPIGCMHWNGNEWTVLSAPGSHYHELDYLLTTERKFCGNVYSKKDIDFYKPFYYIPTTGTKVEISHKEFDTIEHAPHESTPHVPDAVHKEVIH